MPEKMPQQPSQALPKDVVSEDVVSEDVVQALARVLPSHRVMTNACELLAASQRQLTEQCLEFEALLDTPETSLGALRQAQIAVRAAGMKSMGLTTEYLSQLNRYMQILESPPGIPNA